MSDRFDSQEFHELMMDYRSSLLDPAAAYERVLEFIRSTPMAGAEPPKQGEAGRNNQSEAARHAETVRECLRYSLGAGPTALAAVDALEALAMQQPRSDWRLVAAQFMRDEAASARQYARMFPATAPTAEDAFERVASKLEMLSEASPYGLDCAAPSVEPAPAGLQERLDQLERDAGAHRIDAMALFTKMRDLCKLYAAPHQEPGWVRVPVEPTPEMINAHELGIPRILPGYVGAKAKADKEVADRYRAMLAAAPQEPKP